MTMQIGKEAREELERFIQDELAWSDGLAQVMYDFLSSCTDADEAEQAEAIARLRSELAAMKEKQFALVIPDECPHIIVYDDADLPNETFAGYGAREAALRRYEQISSNWNAHLFVQIDANARDSENPSARVQDNSELVTARLLLEKAATHMEEDAEDHFREKTYGGSAEFQYEIDMALPKKIRQALANSQQVTDEQIDLNKET